MIGCLVTTYNRPEALRRSLPQIVALGSPVLVIDDGSENAVNRGIVEESGASYLRLPSNRGLASALSIGISYWLADRSVEWISYFQDDVDVEPHCLDIIRRVQKCRLVMTGHDAAEHQAHSEMVLDGIPVKYKWAIRATHIHAPSDVWSEFLPIPTRELGAPKRLGPGRGLGSNVDWWIVRDSPRSCQKTKRPVLCVPGLVRSFLWKGEDSCWNNTQKSGEEPALRKFA